jgi:phage tail-like protein
MSDGFNIVAAAFFDVSADGQITYGVWNKMTGGTQKLKEVKSQFITKQGKPLVSVSSAGFENQPVILERPLLEVDRQGLIQWYTACRDGDMSSARQNLNVVVRTTAGAPLMTLSYFRCLALDYQLSGMDAQSGNAIIEKLVVSYEDVQIKSA